MNIIDDVLERNRAFAADQEPDSLGGKPRLRLAVVTCMDCRIDALGALGLTRGDAHILRNAGGVVSDDVIRSLAISQRRLGTRAVMLIHHTECGMLTLSEDGFREELQAEVGMAPPFAIESFRDLEDDVRQSIRRVRQSPFVPHRDEVRGFVLDVSSHALREVPA